MSAQSEIHVEITSPVGPLRLATDGRALTGIRFLTGRLGPRAVSAVPDLLREPIRQLEAYFAGELRDFDLALAPEGTPFQRIVWEELRRIPYGATISYAELARRIGRPAASRAVGAANGRNPIPIVIPCHRVIGASGDLTGFGGGIAAKKKLLEIEGSSGWHTKRSSTKGSKSEFSVSP